MNLWPLAVYVAIVGMLVVTMLSVSFVLGQRHQDRATGSPYESRASAVPGQVLSGRDVLRHLRC
jgi:NADH:ubiquinone oxidoreductase subunit 3 (subunit A)